MYQSLLSMSAMHAVICLGSGLPWFPSQRYHRGPNYLEVNIDVASSKVKQHSLPRYLCIRVFDSTELTAVLTYWSVGTLIRSHHNCRWRPW
jgi:hypothetical protein